MKKLKLLALSDLHLGEREGLLYNKGANIVDITVNKIYELATGGNGFEDGIDELVLIGDIVDLSEATEKEAYSNTLAFLTALLGKVKIDKIKYIIGNHDHHLWVEMLKYHYNKKSYDECTPKTGFAIPKPQQLIEKCIPPDYKGDVEAHYPFYKLKMENSTFLFDHGHLFSSLLNRLAGSAGSIEEIEEKTYEFMEAIWFKGKMPFRKRFYDLREKIYDWARWLTYKIKYPDRKVAFQEDSTPVYDDGLRNRVIGYLEKIDDGKTKDFHLVFGHTHYGGRVLRDDRKIRLNGRFISLWNTGGWLVPSDIFSPDAYIFYIEQTLNGVKPQAYKLVGKKDINDEGDYDWNILPEIEKRKG